MLGRDLDEFYPPRAEVTRGAPLLTTRGLSGRVVQDVRLVAHAGEVLGVTGLAGMGQQELPQLLAGAQRATAGSVEVDGVVLDPDPRAAIDAGVALVPGNRQRDGVWLQASATENISLPVLGSFVRSFVLRRRDERHRSRTMMEQFLVRPVRVDRSVASFSGGNQQKIVLAKWMQNDPRVLLLDEPTQGVDAGARREILELVVERAAAGGAVVIFSTDLEQLAAVCNRVLVMFRGQIVRELEGAALTEDALLQACQAM
jgi:ribose transport system ATP-binding protein